MDSRKTFNLESAIYELPADKLEEFFDKLGNVMQEEREKAVERRDSFFFHGIMIWVSPTLAVEYQCARGHISNLTDAYKQEPVRLQSLRHIPEAKSIDNLGLDEVESPTIGVIEWPKDYGFPWCNDIARFAVFEVTNLLADPSNIHEIARKYDARYKND